MYLTNRDTTLSTKEPPLLSQTSHTEEKTDATEQGEEIKDEEEIMDFVGRQRIMCRPLLSPDHK